MALDAIKTGYGIVNTFKDGTSIEMSQGVGQKFSGEIARKVGRRGTIDVVTSRLADGKYLFEVTQKGSGYMSGVPAHLQPQNIKIVDFVLNKAGTRLTRIKSLLPKNNLIREFAGKLPEQYSSIIKAFFKGKIRI